MSCEGPRGSSTEDLQSEIFAMGSMRLCILLSCLFPLTISVRKLDNLDDLKNTTYAKFPPRHGLQLLFWFAGVVNIDQNNVLRCSHFDPRRGDFGFYPFKNTKFLHPSLNNTEEYYSVGNLNYPKAGALPHYLMRYKESNHPRNNMDRLIVSLDHNKVIRRIYITAHKLYMLDFHSFDTYEIDSLLISLIKGTYHCNLNVYPHEAEKCSQFLQNMGYGSSFCHDSRRKKRSEDTDSQCHTCEGLKLKIKATSGGYTKVTWEDIPEGLTQPDKKVYIDVCQNIYSGNNEHPTQVIKETITVKNFESKGNLDINVLLNAGLQPRLRVYLSLSDIRSDRPYILYGAEFDEANRFLPADIKGFDASLQLIVKNGKACARLYIMKTFDWKNTFKNSWVGFYKNTEDTNYNYYTYQYIAKFALVESTKDYYIYQYDSSLTISHSVQIRFLEDKGYDNNLAETESWNNCFSFPKYCKHLQRTH